MIMLTTLFMKIYNNSIAASGCLASDPLVLHRLGHALLQLSPLEPKRTRSILIADDLFQLSKVPVQKAVYVISKTVEALSSCEFHILQLSTRELLPYQILDRIFW